MEKHVVIILSLPYLATLWTPHQNIEHRYNVIEFRAINAPSFRWYITVAISLIISTDRLKFAGRTLTHPKWNELGRELACFSLTASKANVIERFVERSLFIMDGFDIRVTIISLLPLAPDHFNPNVGIYYQRAKKKTPYSSQNEIVSSLMIKIEHFIFV